MSGDGTKLYRLPATWIWKGRSWPTANSLYADNARTPRWIKVKNADYTQKRGRAALFEKKK
jgi:hypothetical protein